MITAFPVASLVSAMDSVIPWVNKLRPLEVVGVIATGMAAMSAACVIAILTINRGKPLVQDDPCVGDPCVETEAVNDEPLEDDSDDVEPLILGAFFFAVYDGDYKGQSDSWGVYSYIDVQDGKARRLLTLASKENAAALIERLDGPVVFAPAVSA